MPTVQARPRAARTAPSPVAAIFAREPSDPRVIVAEGGGTSITVDHGHLVVSDGIGKHRRQRRYSRIERQLKRLVIVGNTGYITLDALKWCHDVGVQVVNIDRQGQSVITSTTDHTDSRLIRAQAFTGADGPDQDTGTEIVRMILRSKLDGQRSVASAMLRSEETTDYLTRQIGRLSNCPGVREMRIVEAHAALAYWTAWTGVRLAWRNSDTAHVPAHWLMYGQRHSPATRGASRHSTDPTNSILNYAYGLATAECRFALVAVGLDPSLGYLHMDEQSRDSLALDMVEIIRPDIDAWALSTVAPSSDRTLDRQWFYELPDGTCRLVAPLTHMIAEQMPLWASSISPYVDRIARMISDVGKGDVRPSVRPKRDRTVPTRTQPANRPQRVKFPTPVTVESIIPDSLWSDVEPLIPIPARRDGRPWAHSRAVLAGILCVEMLGSSWAQIPATLGVTRWTCKARLDKWQTDGVWDDIRDAVASNGHLKLYS